MKRATICLDTETLQRSPYHWYMADVEPDKFDAKYKQLVNDSSLDPALGGLICVIGYAVSESAPDGVWSHHPVQALSISEATEIAERDMLLQFQRVISEYDAVFVAFNGAFDFRWLCLRAARYGLWPLARAMHMAKPWGDRRHVDPRDAWLAGADRSAKGRGRLTDVGWYLGCDIPPDGIRGSEVSQAWADGRSDLVVHHCKADVQLLRDVYWRMRLAGMIDGTDAVPELTEYTAPRGTRPDYERTVRLLQPAMAAQLEQLSDAELQALTAAALVRYMGPDND